MQKEKNFANEEFLTPGFKRAAAINIYESKITKHTLQNIPVTTDFGAEKAGNTLHRHGNDIGFYEESHTVFSMVELLKQ